jgi:hypothetical protein
MTAKGEARMTAVEAIEHEWMLPCEVAQMLRMSERTLEGKRLAGTGPDYYRKGPGVKAQVLYRRSDVIDWLEKFRVTGAQAPLRP